MSTDLREAFIQGARWWAMINEVPMDEQIPAEAERHYPKGQRDPDLSQKVGTWPPDYPGRAFVEGARKQEWLSTGATMWQSDQRDAEEEALRRWAL